MLNQSAFANSSAILTAALYTVFYLVSLIAPDFFRLLFNAQFLGADVASLLPKELTLGSFIVTLVIMVITVWVFVYIWVWLYNRLSR